MTNIPLDVVLNGERNYIQGTQILARCAEVALSGGNGVLRQVAFHKITDRLVAIVQDDPSPEVGIIGQAIFEDAVGGVVPVAWTTLDSPAPRANNALSCGWERINDISDHPLSASFLVRGLTCGEDYLNVLIQAIKSLHAELAEDVSDIWFTGLRRADIPLPTFPEAEGRLTISFERMMARGVEFQSIQRARFEGRTGFTAQAVVTFAFKSGSYSHVN